jgi:hypothetical protein
MAATTSDFDLDRYLRASKRVDVSGVDWDLIKDTPLPWEEARCLAYMMDIESHTAIFLRDLLATRAAFDPDVTAFLSCWVYEELWHGEAFSWFLGEAGYEVAPAYEPVSHGDRYPTRSDRNAWIRRRLGAKGYASHVATLVGSALLRDFVAIHMTWGAANELTTLTSYHRLIAKTDHPSWSSSCGRSRTTSDGTSRSTGRRPGCGWLGHVGRGGSSGGRSTICGPWSGPASGRRARPITSCGSCSVTRTGWRPSRRSSPRWPSSRDWVDRTSSSGRVARR